MYITSNFNKKKYINDQNLQPHTKLKTCNSLSNTERYMRDLK